MLKQIRNIIPLPAGYALGIEVFIKNAGQFEYNIVSLVRNKEEIRINDIKSGLTSIEDLKNYIRYGTPVILSVNGWGILTKKVKSPCDHNKTDILHELLPNAKAADFYIQISEEDDESFVSVIRKTLLQTIIDSFVERDFTIYDISLGYHFLQYMASSLAMDDTISIREEIITFKNGRLENITKVKNELPKATEVRLKDEILPSEALNPFAAAFSYFFHKNNHVSVSEEFDYLREEHKYKVRLRSFGAGVLLFLFILLIGNYLVLIRNNEILDRQSVTLFQNAKLITGIDSLKREIELKEKLINESGSMNMFSHSYFADRLAYLKPYSITLKSMTIQPLSGKLSENEKISFKNRIIELTGITENSLIINNWIEDIKKESWVSGLHMIEYHQNPDSRDSFFRLNIELK